MKQKIRPVFREHFRNARSDALGRAGDENAFPGEFPALWKVCGKTLPGG